MLQQPVASDSHTPTSSSLSPARSPQAGSSGKVQGAADRGLLQQEGQTIQVPSSRSAAASQQAIPSTSESSIVSDQPALQPLEIIGLFFVVASLLVAIAVHAAKRTKHSEPATQRDDLGEPVPEHQESMPLAVDKQNSTHKKRVRKKQTRRQRRQQMK